MLPVLLLITGMWIELGLTIFQQHTLDNATREAARAIRTGIAPTQAMFNASVCASASSLLTCANLQSRVQSGASFAALAPAVTVSSSGTMSNTSYSIGASGSDVLVQVGYTRTIVTPFASKFIGTNGKLILLSTIAFQNEPD